MTTTPANPNPNRYQLMPEYSAQQFADLKEDIRQHGVLQPIEYDENGNITDGHHRYKAFKELVEEGCDLPMFDRVVRRFDNEEAKIQHVVSLNMQRRHLTPEQVSEVCAKLRGLGYTLDKVGKMVGMTAAGVFMALGRLDDETKAQLAASVASIKSATGADRPATYAPRLFQTGTATLREMVQRQVNAIATQWEPPAANGHAAPAPPTEPQPAPAPATTTISDEDAQKRLLAFTWYGGKASQLKWLLPLLPPCQHFVDVFGGSGAVLLNRAPSPIETYNDLDGNLVCFFRVLRENPAELARLLSLTPFGREERRIAFETLLQHKHDDATLTDMERARRFFVLARQSRSGLAQKEKGELNAWRFIKDSIQRGMPAPIAAWESAIDGLAAVASRLKHVQIENYYASRVIELYDTPGTLFYCDPPYAHETRVTDKHSVYNTEMTDADHTALAAQLHAIKGRAAVSGYPSELYDRLYGDWSRVTMPATATAGMRDGIRSDTERFECLWTNYPLTQAEADHE